MLFYEQYTPVASPDWRMFFSPTWGRQTGGSVPAMVEGFNGIKLVGAEFTEAAQPAWADRSALES